MFTQLYYNICLNRNGYLSRGGLRQVVIEVCMRGQRRALNTHVHIDPRHFANGCIQPSHPDHDLLNRRLRRMLRQLLLLEDEMLDAGRQPTPAAVVAAYDNHQTASATIAEWIDTVIGPSKRKPVTKQQYATVKKSIEDFQPGLHLRDLSHDLLERWQNWMRTERHLAENTIAIRMKVLRCVVNEAIKRNVIRSDDDPFRRIRIPEIKARREHLDEHELGLLEQVVLSDNARLAHVRDAFLFCCYTGLRWGDFRSLTSACLQGTVLTLRQHKTGHPLCLPLALLFQGKALALLGRYKSIEQLARLGDNKQTNADLRLVGCRAGIAKHLHWHLARHTCGTLLNQQGLRMQEIQFILGHQRQATTERHYAETLFSQVEQSLRHAFGVTPPSSE